MPHSRFVAALLCVALVHAALIAVFVTSTQAPLPRHVQVATIAAQLLPAEPDAARTARAVRPATPSMIATAQPQVHQKLADTAAPDAHSGTQPPPKSRSYSSATALPSPATSRAIAAASAAPARQPSHPASNVSSNSANSASPAAQPVASAANANSAANPAARETMALAAPKRVEHADCRIVKPAYPELSKRRGETGTANVRFVIGTSGSVESVTLAKSSGFTRLDDAAMEALRASTCQPYTENGSTIRVSVVQAFTFGLDDD